MLHTGRGSNSGTPYHPLFSYSSIPGEGEAAEVESGEDSCGVDDREPQSRSPQIMGCYVTKSTLDKALKSTT